MRTILNQGVTRLGNRHETPTLTSSKVAEILGFSDPGYVHRLSRRDPEKYTLENRLQAYVNTGEEWIPKPRDQEEERKNTSKSMYKRSEVELYLQRHPIRQIEKWSVPDTTTYTPLEEEFILHLAEDQKDQTGHDYVTRRELMKTAAKLPYSQLIQYGIDYNINERSFYHKLRAVLHKHEYPYPPNVIDRSQSVKK